MSNSPETDALIRRHIAQSRNISDAGLLRTAVRQASELIAHARILERQRDEAVELLRAVVALDDGDVPMFWGDRETTLMDNARAFLARIEKEKQS